MKVKRFLMTLSVSVALASLNFVSHTSQAQAQIQTPEYQWDLLAVTPSPTTPGVRITFRGFNSARTPDDAQTLTLTGSGTFNPDAGTATGCGLFVIADASGIIARGNYSVKGIVSWTPAPGTPRGLNFPAFGDPLKRQAGILKLLIQVEGLGEGMLTINCRFGDTPMGIVPIEGTTLTGGGFNFSKIMDPSITVFHRP